MIEKRIRAEKSKQQFGISLDFGSIFLIADFDTGASATVIAVDVFTGKMSEDNRKKLIDFFEKKKVKKKIFKSASGDNVSGYPVCAENIRIGGVEFSLFFYYLILDSKRSIALIGYDFINHCQFSHKIHGDIFIDDFDFKSYVSEIEEAVSEADFLTFLDELEE